MVAMNFFCQELLDSRNITMHSSIEIANKLSQHHNMYTLHISTCSESMPVVQEMQSNIDGATPVLDILSAFWTTR